MLFSFVFTCFLFLEVGIMVLKILNGYAYIILTSNVLHFLVSLEILCFYPVFIFSYICLHIILSSSFLKLFLHFVT